MFTFDTLESTIITPKSTIITPTNMNDLSVIKCIYCNNKFTRSDSLKRHYNICKVKNEKNNKLEQENELLKAELKKRDEETKEQLENLKQQMLELMNKQFKVHPKTLTKINKQLNNQINNNITNNFIMLGSESLDTFFTKNQQLEVLSKKYSCLDYLVTQTHFNDKYPQFKTIMITNTRDNIAYKYDKTEMKFLAVDKNKLIDEVINERMSDIEMFYDKQIDHLDDRTKNIIQKFIDKMDGADKKYYQNKMNDIKLIIYNNRNKVSKELSQDLQVLFCGNIEI